MTHQFTLAAALVLFGSIFGLSSCSRDRPDDWSFNEPTLESSARLPVPLKSASVQGLPGDSALVMQSAGGQLSSITVETSCRLEGQTASNRLVYSGVSRVALRDLWPEDFWRKFDAEALKTSVCDFDFTAADDVGSTHLFSLHGVSLVDFVSSSHVGEEAVSVANLSLSPVTLTKLESFKNLTLDRPGTRDSKLNFICENFHSEVPFSSILGSSHVSTAPLSEQLLERTIKAPLSPTSGVDPRYEKAIQACRLLRIDLDSVTGQPRYSLSPSFTFLFDPPRLEIKSTLDLQQAYFKTWAHQKIFTVEFSNHSRAPTAIETPKDFGRVHMRIVGQNLSPNSSFGVPLGTYYEGSRLISEALVVSVTGDHSRVPDGDHWIYEIAPESTLRIEARIESREMCIVDNIGTIVPNFAESGHAGLLFGFTSPIVIRQLQFWGEAKSLSSNRIGLDFLDAANVGQVEPTHFTASAGYLAAVDASGRIPTPRSRLRDDLGPDTFTVDFCYFASRAPR